MVPHSAGMERIYTDLTGPALAARTVGNVVMARLSSELTG